VYVLASTHVGLDFVSHKGHYSIRPDTLDSYKGDGLPTTG